MGETTVGESATTGGFFSASPVQHQPVVCPHLESAGGRPCGRLAPSPTGALHLGNIRTFTRTSTIPSTKPAPRTLLSRICGGLALIGMALSSSSPTAYLIIKRRWDASRRSIPAFAPGPTSKAPSPPRIPARYFAIPGLVAAESTPRRKVVSPRGVCPWGRKMMAAMSMPSPGLRPRPRTRSPETLSLLAARTLPMSWPLS